MEITEISQQSAILAGASAAGTGVLIWRLLAWVSGRMDRREDRIDAATKTVIDTLEEMVKGLSARVKLVEHDLVDCQTKHANSEAEVAKLKAIIDAGGEIRQRAAGIVALNRLDDQERNS
jgi:hypothetical protein